MNNNNWKVSLDKYLTTPPDDGFDNWVEVAIDKISFKFYEENEDWLNEYDGVCNKWLNKLFDKGKAPEEAANIIQRTFNLYIKNNNHELQEL